MKSGSSTNTLALLCFSRNVALRWEEEEEELSPQQARVQYSPPLVGEQFLTVRGRGGGNTELHIYQSLSFCGGVH